MKPTKEICGNLAFFPVVGNRAIICCDDDRTLFTSTVVAVRNRTAEGVEIETKNTIYRVRHTRDGGLPYAV